MPNVMTQRPYLTRGDETFAYHFMWVLENGSIRFVQLRYDDEDDE